MYHSPLRPGQAWAAAACLCALLAATPAGAQSDWLKKARDAAKSSQVGKTFSKASVQAQMIDARAVSLEERGLPTVAVGALALGVAGVEIKDDVGVRVHAFLHNPTGQAVSVPVPDPELFVLVDARGRRLERVAGPSIEKLADGAGSVSIPALERVEMTLLFAAPKPTGPTATLKVGELGAIPGIPVHSSAAAAGAQATGAPSVWTTPPAPPPPPDTTHHVAGARPPAAVDLTPA